MTDQGYGRELVLRPTEESRWGSSTHVSAWVITAKLRRWIKARWLDVQIIVATLRLIWAAIALCFTVWRTLGVFERCGFGVASGVGGEPVVGRQLEVE